MTPIISIMIPLTPDRELPFSYLMAELNRQIQEWCHEGEAELYFDLDNKEISIGEKRQRMYQRARGKYSWQIDSDDFVSPNAIRDILRAADQNIDVITFKEHCTINGIEFTSNHSLKYADWAENADGYDFVRTPFMKSVIKTEIAKSVDIPFLRYGEDHAWARLLKPILKTEFHFDKFIYYYQHHSKPENFNTRYGITQ